MSKDEIQGSLHCGGKSAAYGREDVFLGWVEENEQKQWQERVFGQILNTATVRVYRKPVTVAADQIDDEPDDANQYEKRS